MLAATQIKHSKPHKRRSGAAAAAIKAAADEDAAKACALAKLRSERLEREAAEKHRALQALGLLPAGANKRFNNSYGYADALRHNGNSSSTGAVAAARGASAAAVAGLSQRFKV